ncbi:cAMP-responsive element modulator isoform X1 [Vidua macroura]|uniref:cAMP-responsive element modulator isoform X1 n=2 Tax=Vidua macroura TaxID=187451 RepID=UPI0023A8B6EB|nr:cAMP-responsive element modulator isoform X1 [Vidua macroura]XP_053840730.1 cAMP-responsive element modulator isoform X1 [Vidua macroura]
MTKCAKKYRKGAVRLMTMEMVEQDDNAVDSLTERSAGPLQSQPGQNQISSGSEVSVAASSAGRGSPAVTLVQLPSGQTVHVQGVIQATQPSVIQSPHMQAVQVASIADEAAQSEVIIDSQKRREILSRRPSYRKILNELSSDAPAVAKIEEEEKSEDEGTPSGISAMAMPTSLYHTNTGQYLTISQGGTIQTVTNSGAPQPGATIVQYAAQSSDGTQQFFVPGSQVVVQGCQTAVLRGGEAVKLVLLLSQRRRRNLSSEANSVLYRENRVAYQPQWLQQQDPLFVGLCKQELPLETCQLTRFELPLLPYLREWLWQPHQGLCTALSKWQKRQHARES